MDVNFGGIGLNLLRFCLQHSDGFVGETDPTQYGHTPDDYAWLKESLNNLENDSERMKKLLTYLNNENVNEIIYALEGIQYFVEDLDLAKDLVKLDGIKRIVSLLTHENANVRRWSSWIIASLTQNNPNTQNILTSQHDILSVLTKAILNETDDQAKDKQLYAFSSVTSGSKSLMDQFVDSYNGIPLLVSILGSNLPSTKFKAVWFLYKLLASRPSNMDIARKTDMVPCLIKIVAETEKEDLREKAVEILTIYVNNDTNNAKECKSLGLDKVLEEILKKLVKEEEKKEEIEACKLLLTLISV